MINAITSLGQPNWFDYIQLSFVILGVLISAWAVWIAKKIPKEIAHKQDNIALFDKRFQAYEILEKYVWCSQLLKGPSNNSYKDLIVFVFFEGNENAFEYRTVLLNLEQISAPLKRISFLFDDIEKEEIDKIMSLLGCFIKAFLDNDSNAENYKEKYIEYVDAFEKRHYDEIIKALKIPSLYESKSQYNCKRKGGGTNGS